MRDKLDRSVILISIACALLLLNTRLNIYAAIVHWINCLLVIVGLSRARSFRLILYWRTLPLYFLNLVIGIIFIVDTVQRDGVQGYNVPCGVLLLISSIISAILVFLFPLPTADPLIGKHKYIGTFSFNFPLNHECCPESLRGMDKENKEVTVQIWFPLDPEKFSLWDKVKHIFSRKAMLWTSGNPLVEDIECSSLLTYTCKSNGLPAIFAAHLPLAFTNSVYTSDLSNMLITSEPMPVAFHSHGMYGWRQISSNMCESLASMGYLCVSCDHTPDCMFTRPAYTPLTCQTSPLSHADSFKEYGFHVPADMEDRVYYGQGLKRRLFDIDSLVHFLLYLQSKQAYAQHSQKYIFDLPVYDEIKRVFQPLEGKIDVYRQLSMWGHSYGGGTVTAYACLHPTPVSEKRQHDGSSLAIPPLSLADSSQPYVYPLSTTPLHPHISSIVALDGWMYPVPDALRKRGIQDGVGILKLSAQRWGAGKYQAPFRADVIERSRRLKAGYDMIIKDTDHQNFCEAYLLANHVVMYRPNTLGGLEPLGGGRAIARITAAFFERNRGVHVEGLAESQQPDKIQEEREVESALLKQEDDEKKENGQNSIAKSPKNLTAENLLAYCTHVHPPYTQCIDDYTAWFVKKYVVHANELTDFPDYSYFNSLPQ